MQFKLGGDFGYWLLTRLSKKPGPRAVDSHGGPSGREKIERLLGANVMNRFVGKTVLDFGCGEGAEAIAVAQAGACVVIGTDVLEERLERARRAAIFAGVEDRCIFLHAHADRARIEDLAGGIDCAYSLDAFEHFGQPANVLEQFFQLLAPGGELLVSFGPPWKHPFGAHMKYFIKWPWPHFVFDEETLLRVRALHRNDGARCFAEVDGGLNQMTLSRFRKLVAESGFEMKRFRPVPLSTRFVRRTPLLFWWMTLPVVREYLTSVVLCDLVKPQQVAWEEPALAGAGDASAD